MAISVPKIDPLKIEQQLRLMQREPFLEILARILGSQPTPKAVQIFANKYPDRWAQTCSIFAGLTGYSKEKIEFGGEIIVKVQAMSDAQLAAYLQALKDQLSNAVHKTIEIQKVEEIQGDTDLRKLGDDLQPTISQDCPAKDEDNQ